MINCIQKNKWNLEVLDLLSDEDMNDFIDHAMSCSYHGRILTQYEMSVLPLIKAVFEDEDLALNENFLSDGHIDSLIAATYSSTKSYRGKNSVSSRMRQKFRSQLNKYKSLINSYVNFTPIFTAFRFFLVFTVLFIVIGLTTMEFPLAWTWRETVNNPNKTSNFPDSNSARANSDLSQANKSQPSNQGTEVTNTPPVRQQFQMTKREKSAAEKPENGRKQKNKNFKDKNFLDETNARQPHSPLLSKVNVIPMKTQIVFNLPDTTLPNKSVAKLNGNSPDQKVDPGNTNSVIKLLTADFKSPNRGKL